MSRVALGALTKTCILFSTYFIHDIILGTIDTIENVYSSDINSVFVATIGSVRLCNINNCSCVHKQLHSLATHCMFMFLCCNVLPL